MNFKVYICLKLSCDIVVTIICRSNGFPVLIGYVKKNIFFAIVIEYHMCYLYLLKSIYLLLYTYLSGCKEYAYHFINETLKLNIAPIFCFKMCHSLFIQRSNDIIHITNSKIFSIKRFEFYKKLAFYLIR